MEGSLFGSSQYLTRNYMGNKPLRVPNGVRAPRCSLAPPAPSPVPEDSPRLSMESFYTVSQKSLEESKRPVEMPWQDYEIPEELGLVKDDAPREIRNIVQESLDEHRALRISRMQAPALVTLTANSSSISMVLPQEPDNKGDSDVEDEGLLKPPKPLGPSSRTGSLESLRATETSNKNFSASMSNLEKRFQESRLRTRKGYKKFKLLPGRKMKDKPTLPLLKIEPAVSECTSCLDDIPDEEAVALPCRHKYCKPCFSLLVSTAILGEDTFPPKCCLSEVPKSTIHHNLPTREWKTFSEKASEYAVPVANRYYCASPSCAKWIDARNAKRTNGALECPHCRENLCTVCRGPSHPSNEDCPQDFGLDRLMEEADWSGWQRCSECRGLVERHHGCLHITCKCHYQFCYCCGAKWPTCRCTEEDQLRRETEGRARRAQAEADQSAKEEAVRAAIAAVEAAEREIQRELEAEEAGMAQEAREIESLEVGRLSNIADYYEYLRGVLECSRLQQRQVIETRHDQEWAKIDKIREGIKSPEMTAEREQRVNAEKSKIVADHEAKIRELQRSHAHAMIEAIAHHRKAQDELLTASISSLDENTELMNPTKLENLMPMQEAERSVLNSQQKRELQKWRGRHTVQLGEFDAKSKILQLRLKDLEDISRRKMELKSKIFADSKWFELLFDKRMTMLSEDQNRMMNSGADAPPKPNNRDTVVMPKREAPAAAAPELSTRETLGLPMPSPTSPTFSLHRSPRTHRANSGRSARYEPDWDEIHAIANARKQGDMRRSWHHGVLGTQVRVG